MRSPHMLRGILFDFDGVLIDLKPHHQASIADMTERMGGQAWDRLVKARPCEWRFSLLLRCCSGAVEPRSAPLPRVPAAATRTTRVRLARSSQPAV